MIYTISDLAKEFQVTTRTIRYYEELKLLSPKRSKEGKRLYSKREYTRLKLIVRGKKYGFSLDEIKDMVILFDKDRTGIKQLERTVEYGHLKCKEIQNRIEELTEMKEEMEKLLDDFTNRLDKRRSPINS